MSLSKRTIIALVLVVGGLVYLISSAVSNTTMYYVTVEEALAKGVDADKGMRIQGNVVGESINWQPRELLLRFAVAGESGESIKAVYHGPRPDNFTADAPAILEGRFGTDGVFQVEKLMLACPSRFEAEGAEHPGTMEFQYVGE